MNWETKTDVGGFRIRWSAEVAARYLAEGHFRNETLTAIARQAVETDPTRVLLAEGEQQITRGQAWETALRLAHYLLERGIRPGDVVSYQLPNWSEATLISLAARMIGAVINPIPPIYREAELGYILKDCRSRLLFAPELFRKHNYQSMLHSMRSNLPDLREVVTVRGAGAVTWADATAHAPIADSALPKVDPASVMMVMYTSGTTGRPKGVLHTHYGYDYRVRSMGEAWSIGPQDTLFMPSPLTHITGAFWAVDMPWVRDTSAVLLDVWTAASGMDCIARHHCTVSGGATPFLQQILAVAAHTPESLASLRLFFCGGTTVSPELISQASQAFPHCLFFRAYGSTEVPTASLGIRSRSQSYYGAHTDGQIVYPTEIKLISSQTGAPVADGEEGEILARGPEQFVGYIDATDNRDAFDQEGYFHMGDLGERVAGEFLVVTGRKKDIIIRSGENISPKEVEDILFTHPAVAEIAIVAMPSASTGEKGCAFVIPTPGSSVDLPLLTAFLRTTGLARQKYPEHLVLMEDLPRVASGKVRKDQLRKLAQEIAAQEQT